MKSGVLLAFIFAAVASLRLSADKRFAYLNFSGLKDTARVNYTLVYDTASGQKGVEGAIRLKNRTNRTSKVQLLGTCSSKKCVYHKGIKNVHLETTFVSRTGGSTTSANNLP